MMARRCDLRIGAVACRACGYRHAVPIERMPDFVYWFVWMTCPHCREVTMHEEVML